MFADSSKMVWALIAAAAKMAGSSFGLGLSLPGDACARLMETWKHGNMVGGCLPGDACVRLMETGRRERGKPQPRIRPQRAHRRPRPSVKQPHDDTFFCKKKREICTSLRRDNGADKHLGRGWGDG